MVKLTGLVLNMSGNHAAISMTQEDKTGLGLRRCLHGNFLTFIPYFLTNFPLTFPYSPNTCLLYTSDAADE